VSALATVLFLLAGDAPYRVERTNAPHEALLAAADAPWAVAQRVEWGPSTYATAFRALWDEKGLHLRFDARDPQPWHTMTGRDEHLWDEEVVEIFLDPDRSGRDYYELEMNPANVVCDLRMISPSPKKQGDLGFNLEGLETRVRLNTDGAGKTVGWTATAFLPWSGFAPLPSARKVALPPKAGDAWRFNVFRIDRPGGKAAPEKNAIAVAYSPPPGESFHVPEVFQDFVFAPRK
jgi:Carbohydrate family 9 binding domain-like